MAIRSRPIGPLLLLPALFGCDCGETRLVAPPEPEPRTDSLCQIPASSIDILFVVDDSRSMTEEQEALSANFGRFLELIDPDPTRNGERGEVDYRIAVTTTDAFGTAGELVGSPVVVRPGAGYDPLAAFQENVKVGAAGGAFEQGLQSAELALQKAAALQDDRGRPLFVREGAYLYVIIVSDEEDSSVGEVRYYQRFFEQFKGIGNENAVALSAIAGPVPSGCATAAAGRRYREVAEATGGLLGSICTESWEETLRDLAVSGIGLQKRFQLAVPPKDYDESGFLDEPDLIVKVKYPCDVPNLQSYLTDCLEVTDSCASDGFTTCVPYYGHPDGWRFDEAEKSLAFDGHAVPGPGSCVEVTYFERDL